MIIHFGGEHCLGFAYIIVFIVDLEEPCFRLIIIEFKRIDWFAEKEREKNIKNRKNSEQTN